jgi:hypothetical protein
MLNFWVLSLVKAVADKNWNATAFHPDVLLKKPMLCMPDTLQSDKSIKNDLTRE